MSIFDVFQQLWRTPRELLVRRWNWKSAVFSSTIRAAIFFFCNLRAGWSAATGAMLAEFAYRSVTAGFYGALTQSFRKATPTWAANLVAMFLLPLASHSLEFCVHLLRHTPKLKTSIITSVCFTGISTLFNLYAMRRGALIVGEEACSASDDLKRIPSLLGGFVACGPLTIYRLSVRSVSAITMRSAALLPFLLLLAATISAAEANGRIAESPRTYSRTYTASAYIQLISVSIFSRNDVGGGFASMEETPQGQRLRFLSGSTPEHTHGLNRMGYIEESVTEVNGKPASVNYYGIITANKEESFQQARAALSARNGREATYTAAVGSLTDYDVRRLQLPANFKWSNSSPMLDQARVLYSSAPVVRSGHTEGQGSDTFLDAIVRAIRAREAVRDTTVVHNGKLFRLHTEKTADPHSAPELQHAGLSADGNLMRMKGSLRGVDSKSESCFRLWFDSGSENPLPLRFEMRPRSFLKLVFDAQPE